MARKSGNAGWVVAGIFGLMLAGRCSDSPQSPAATDQAVSAYQAPVEVSAPEEPAEPPAALDFTPQPALAGPTCGSKRYCGQMNSCSEATHYLNECGLSRLDRDGDGVPCESIC